jgi:putative restriction endonuclease
MKLFVAVTDYQWYSLHASKPQIEEVNFWKPSTGGTFKALQVGEPVLFKLHAPRNYIAGGGFFARFTQLPISLAWDAFGEGNGATSLEQVRARIAQYRREPIGPHDDPHIGCILLVEPFFFAERDWIPCPPDFALNTVTGKTYDATAGTGRALWIEVAAHIAAIPPRAVAAGPAIAAAIETARYGNPVVVQPRLGQGSFRVVVTDVYNRRCAMTNERTLPVLEAAHIRPYALGGPHDPRNGLLLRSDLHRLFDQGYMTVDPNDPRIVVSGRIREEFENGRDYYRLHGQRLAMPTDAGALPSPEFLAYHAENVFR